MRELRKFYFSIAALLASLVIFANTQNQLGTIGANLTPTARFMEEGSLSYMISNQKSFNRLNFVAQPYDWLEVSFFYADIKNKDYPASKGSQSYKDKGFNVKLLLLEEKKFLPQLSLGLTDFAGTGIYSGEFLVGSKKISKNIDLSIGVGWGLYAGRNSFKNPLIEINESFSKRNYNFGETVGEFDIKDYFSGSEVSIFSSIKFDVGEKSSFILEYNPITDVERFDEIDGFSDIYFGYNYGKGSQYDLSIFYGSNNEINFSFSANQNFAKLTPKYKRSNAADPRNQVNFLQNLQLNNIGLKDLIIDDEKLVIGIRQNSYLDVKKAFCTLLAALKDAGYDYKEVVVKNYSFGEVITSDLVDLNSEKITSIDDPNENVGDKIYELAEQFPQTKTSFTPNLKTFIASREAFLLQSVAVNYDSTTYFSESTFIDASFSLSLYDNFDELYLEPVNTYPALVRSDIKDYLREFSSGLNLERLEINHFRKTNNNYLAFKAGIFEAMFGGYGFEYLRLNQFSNFAYGFEIYEAYKRDYSYDLDFLEYKNTTGHINFYHFFNPLELTTHLSWGEYLAGDKGFSIDMSKRFENGLKFGFFATFTDVTSEQYGEGSFNKGIYFSLPIDSLIGNGTTTDFVWSPLTKDPGQKLNHRYKLFNLIERFVY